MNRIVYLVFGDFDRPASCGIKNKIIMQLTAFYKLGFEVKLINIKNNIINLYHCFNDQKKESYIGCSRIDLNHILINLIIDINPSICYIRHPKMNYFNYLFYKNLRHSINAKIIAEIPTYPYSEEDNNKNLSMIDLYYNDQLSSYCDLIVNYNGYNEIFGIPSVSIFNGIQSDKYPMIQHTKKNHTIQLLGVASLEPWQGYDRLIEGISQYYMQEVVPYHIIFRIIGEGKDLQYLKNLTKDKNLEHVISFAGIKRGNDLNIEFNQSDIAVGSLGRHRVNLTNMSTIKAAEYCIRGIPFIVAHREIAFPDNYPYILTLPADESPININKLIDFYENLDYKICALEMSNYAHKVFEWETQMNKIIIKLKE